MTPLAICDVSNTYQWQQLREQLLNLRLPLTEKSAVYHSLRDICNSWIRWTTSCKKLIGDGKIQEDY